MDQTIRVRDAAEADLPAILAIYNDAVETTTAIWNETVVDLENRIAWFFTRVAKGYPVLVAVRDGAIAGYASYGDWRAFDGFRQTMEHSVYVEKNHRGAGIGRLLMAELIDRARENGVHVLVGCIESGNTGSLRLHDAMGFRLAGTFTEVGQKFGRWLDLSCMELRLETAMKG